MNHPQLCKWRHFSGERILCAVRWYLRYALSYRDVEELMRERWCRSAIRRCCAGTALCPLLALAPPVVKDYC
jgi:transposase-like protein